MSFLSSLTLSCGTAYTIHAADLGVINDNKPHARHGGAKTIARQGRQHKQIQLRKEYEKRWEEMKAGAGYNYGN